MFILSIFQPLLLLTPDEGAGGGGQASGGEGQQQQQQGDQQQQGGAGEGQQHGGSSQRDERVPYDRFAEVNDQLRQTRQELQQLREQQTQREREGLSETDRIRAELADATRAREEAERRATEAEQARQTADRQGWVRDAARAARFHDPEDAIARIDTSVLRTPDAARREVEALAERAKHLVAPEQQQERSGADMLQQVLERGERVTDREQKNGSGSSEVIPAEDFNKLSVDQLVSLQERDPALYERSLRAAAAA